MSTMIMRHLPALLIATPLFAAFLMPLVGAAGRWVRTAWVFLGAALTATVGLLLAWQVFTTGPVLYVFGAGDPTQTLPGDAAFPIRIMFAVDALSALMIVIASCSSLAITLYSLNAEARQSGAQPQRTQSSDGPHETRTMPSAPATATTRSSHFALLPVPAFDGKPIPPAKPSVNSRANISRLCRRRRALLG